MLAVLWIGCHSSVRFLPSYSGVVVRDGAPVEGAQIWISEEADDGACLHGTERGTTDRNGAFLVTGYETRDFFFASESALRWNLCILDGSRRVLAHQGNALSGADVRRIALRCDLSVHVAEPWKAICVEIDAGP